MHRMQKVNSQLMLHKIWHSWMWPTGNDAAGSLGVKLSEQQEAEMQRLCFTFWKEKWLENEYKYYTNHLKLQE